MVVAYCNVYILLWVCPAVGVSRYGCVFKQVFYLMP